MIKEHDSKSVLLANLLLRLKPKKLSKVTYNKYKQRLGQFVEANSRHLKLKSNELHLGFLVIFDWFGCFPTWQQYKDVKRPAHTSDLYGSSNGQSLIAFK